MRAEYPCPGGWPYSVLNELGYMTDGILSMPDTTSSILSGGSRLAWAVYPGLEPPRGLSATPSPASTTTSTPRRSSGTMSLDAFHRYLARPRTPSSLHASSTLQTSRHVTAMPISRNLSARADPTTPAAPVISARNAGLALRRYL